MVSLSLKKRSAFLSILLLLFLSLSGGNNGMVICILPGGHIEFEGVLEGCCDAPQGETSSATNTFNSGEEAEAQDCEACVDIPLSGMENCVASGHSPAFSKNLTAEKTINGALHGFLLAKAPLSHLSHQKTRHLAPVRSVTLRI